MKFNDEQLRLLVNVELAYDTWIAAQRDLDDRFEHRLAWKTVSGRDYLYRLRDRAGNGTSLGPRSEDTEKEYATYGAERLLAQSREASLRERLAELWPLYRALRLPTINEQTGRVLRAADRHGLLGSALVVVGTNTMAAYEIDAQERFATGLDATEDCDLAWAAEPKTAIAVTERNRTPLLSMLRMIDSTYTVNMERDFQARNARGFEVEFLSAPSMLRDFPPAEPLRPLAVAGYEWLLRGRPTSQVVYDRTGIAARIVAPDPRWMALHKLALADDPGRNPMKKGKDRRQGEALLEAVVRNMSHYPMNESFRAEVPDFLQRYLPPA